MTCSHCGSYSSEIENRCRRCGRRPGDSLNLEFPLHGTTGALATKQDPYAWVDTPPASPDWSGAVQGNLFPSKVVTMPGRGAPNRPRTRPASATGAGRQAVRRSRPPVEGQGELDFMPSAQSKPKTLGTTVDAMIACEVDVASPVHRMLAAALDSAMVLIGFGLFWAVFVARYGLFAPSRVNLMICAGTLALIAIAYGLFWAILGTETAGMRWAHLRLVNFHGFPPDSRQRYCRLAGTCLSLLSILGILWCMADEEGLAWQDHISSTFPTADDFDSRVFRRR